MIEISKMYENANAYKMLCNCEFKNLYDYRIEYGSDVCDYTESKIKEPCKVCKKAKQKIKYYPDFTAEKQLKIVKFLLRKGDYYDTDGVYYDTDGDTYWFHFTDEIENVAYRPFEEAIAEFINTLWQDLTDQEKEEIRNILNA